MTYGGAVEYLFGLQRFGVKLGLENMRRLCGALDHPERELRFIHLAGTNGKGSTAAMLDAVLRAAGYRVGLYTSPHLCEVTERIRLGGVPVGQEVFSASVNRVRQVVEGLRGEGVAATFFEVMTAVALDLFREGGVEVVVWETGMGGRLDATNVVDPLGCLLTRVDRDHERWLGSTLGAIAGEKAGILKPGRPAVAVRSGAEPDGVVERRAAEVGAPLRWVEAGRKGRGAESAWSGQWVEVEGAEWFVRLLGTHQRENVALVLAAVEMVRSEGLEVPEKAVRAGLASVHWPGRFEVVRSVPPLVLDGAHNPGAMKRLRETWEEVFGKGPGRLIFGCLAEKAARGLVEMFDEPGREVWIVPVRSERGAEVGDVAGLWREASVQVMASLPQALEGERERVHPDGTLCAGSLYLVGEMLRELTGGRDEVRLNG